MITLLMCGGSSSVIVIVMDVKFINKSEPYEIPIGQGL